MKSLALATALAASLAIPAVAQDHASVAIMHFNMDEDTPGEMHMVPMGMTTVQLSDNATLSEVFQHLNMDENPIETAGSNGVTIIMSDPAHAADVFRMLLEESRGDD